MRLWRSAAKREEIERRQRLDRRIETLELAVEAATLRYAAAAVEYADAVAMQAAMTPAVPGPTPDGTDSETREAL